MSGNLYIVATPIGNLSDITIRAKEVLDEADLVLAEDTRVSGKLFERYEIKTHIISYHHHSSDDKKLEILNLLKSNKSLALITDAGTPGISDPGNELIDFLLKNDENIKVVPIPGVSAITSALSISGFNASHFTFIGFLPKKKLLKTLKEIAERNHPTVYFDSPHRVLKNLEKLSEFVDEARRVLVCRELTKMFETIHRGSIGEVIEKLKKDKIKGEIVVVVE